MWLRCLAPALAAVALLLLLLAGPTVRLGLSDIGTGFGLLRWAAYLGLGSVAVSLVTLLTRTGRRPVLLQVLAAAGAPGAAHS